MNLAILLVIFYISVVKYKLTNHTLYKVDSQLAKETNVGVQEMVNGCMCCVLVGQMKLALEELKGSNSDRRVFDTLT